MVGKSSLIRDVVIACGMGAGTASEVAWALKANKPVFRKISPDNVYLVESLADADTVGVGEAIAIVKAILKKD